MALQPLQERPDVNYHTVAVDFMPPEVVQSSLTRIAAMLAKGGVVTISLLFSQEWKFPLYNNRMLRDASRSP